MGWIYWYLRVEDDDCLYVETVYVGKTTREWGRDAEHRRHSPWYPLVSYRVELYVGSTDLTLAEAEQAGIDVLDPLHNGRAAYRCCTDVRWRCPRCRQVQGWLLGELRRKRRSELPSHLQHLGRR